MSKFVEEWRPVVGYEGHYEVSDWGRVRSVDRVIEQINRWGTIMKRFFRGKILKPCLNADGYRIVSLGKGKESPEQTQRIHKLVAEAFIPNPLNKPQVDHIIPINNGGGDEVWNLRWVTYKENNMNVNSLKNQIKGQKNNKIVYQCDLNGNLIKVWHSASRAAKEGGFILGSVQHCCKGGYFREGKWFNSRTHKGFKWYYENDYKKILLERELESQVQ